MCGIAGTVGLKEELGPEDMRDVRDMVSVLHHRGPDDTGYAAFSRCIFGNTRLRVMDLSEEADLPMSCEGRVWIAYNGEVTNFRELEKRYNLREKYSFRTLSDTEVLLRLYEEEGIDFIRMLTGQFAFFIYDKSIQKAWLVRDPFGIRPLFMHRAGEKLYFASEIKSFLNLDLKGNEVNPEGLFHYFSLGYFPARHTPFTGIEELPGGHAIELDMELGSTREFQYFNIQYKPDNLRGPVETAEELYRQMKDSVRRNLISDAPLGITLSGGFDTSSILSLARENIGQGRIHTYSIVIEDPGFDESFYQRIMTAYADTLHHEIRVGPLEVMEALESQMAFMDEPTADGAAVPSYLLARRASEDVKVLLSGEGGDETFTAYETYRAWKIRKLYRRFLPSPARAALRLGVKKLPVDYSKLSFDFLARRFTEGAELDVPSSHIYWRHTMTDHDKNLLMPGYRPECSTGELVSRIYNSYSFGHELDRISALDLETYLIGDLMVKNDRTIMAHSIETRFPYMDRILFEYACTIPADMRMKGLSGRYIQKMAMKNRLPESIIRRKNMGLELPHSRWLLGAMRPLADKYLDAARIRKTGFLCPLATGRLWEEHQSRRRDNGRALWSIITLMVWYDLFVESRRYRDYLPVPRSIPGLKNRSAPDCFKGCTA